MLAKVQKVSSEAVTVVADRMVLIPHILWLQNLTFLTVVLLGSLPGKILPGPGGIASQVYQTNECVLCSVF